MSEIKLILVASVGCLDVAKYSVVFSDCFYSTLFLTVGPFSAPARRFELKRTGLVLYCCESSGTFLRRKEVATGPLPSLPTTTGFDTY